MQPCHVPCDVRSYLKNRSKGAKIKQNAQGINGIIDKLLRSMLKIFICLKKSHIIRCYTTLEANAQEFNAQDFRSAAKQPDHQDALNVMICYSQATA
eukprot:scaffold18396_cov35-Prasinocladus_malaysianus.AAC.1